MSTDQSILALLAAIEQQNQQILARLDKLTDGQGEQPHRDASGISASRRMEIIQMAHADLRDRKKKQSRGGVRA